MRPRLLLLIAAAAALGCSATNGAGRAAGATGTGASGSSGAGTGGLSLTGSTGVGTGTSSGIGTVCAKAAELVYVFNDAGYIYSFDAPTKTFTKVAKPDCPVGPMQQANSMAIDRNLVAWLNYDGGIYTFPLEVGHGCKLAVSLPSGYGKCGMGFATDAAGGTTETLYIDGIGGNVGLAKIDMSTMSVVPIADFTTDANLTGQRCELTGTGDGRLFGYFTTSPDVRVAQIDKGTAGILSDNELADFGPPDAWAFTFWGGDFYLYASYNGGVSGVVHYSPSTGAVDLSYVQDTMMIIVGAGVSTCAPLTPPT